MVDVAGNARAAAPAARRTCSATSGAPTVPSAGRSPGVRAETHGEQDGGGDRAARGQPDDLLGLPGGPGQREERGEVLAERRVETVGAHDHRRDGDRRIRLVVTVAPRSRAHDERVGLRLRGGRFEEVGVGQCGHGGGLRRGASARPRKGTGCRDHMLGPGSDTAGCRTVPGS